MKRLGILLACIAMLFGCKEVEKSGRLKAEVTLPVVSDSLSLYEDLEGNPVAIKDFKGKRVVLNYWATWCKPCIEEMPAMARAQEILKSDGYIFLFASDQTAAKIIAFRDQRNFGLNFIKYNGNYTDLQISALPVTMIYNTSGEQVERIEGGIEWDSDAMITKLKSL